MFAWNSWPVALKLFGPLKQGSSLGPPAKETSMPAVLTYIWYDWRQWLCKVVSIQGNVNCTDQKRIPMLYPSWLWGICIRIELYGIELHIVMHCGIFSECRVTYCSSELMSHHMIKFIYLVWTTCVSAKKTQANGQKGRWLSWRWSFWHALCTDHIPSYPLFYINNSFSLCDTGISIHGSSSMVCLTFSSRCFVEVCESDLKPGSHWWCLIAAVILLFQENDKSLRILLVGKLDS